MKTASDLIAQAGPLIDARRPIEALAFADRACALEPGLFDAQFTRAFALHNLCRYAEAIAACDRALEIDPDSAKGFALRGLTFKAMKQFERALADLDAALDIDPTFGLLSGESIFLSLQSCEWHGFEDKVARLLAAVDAGKYAAQPFVMSALPSTPLQQRKAAAMLFSSHNLRVGPPVTQTKALGEKLRIGYFSSDFHDHPVGQLIVGLLEAHDKSQVEIVAFAYGGEPASPTRRRIANACDELIDVLGASPDQIAELARARRLHIAVDLNGYTTNARFGIFAAGAAPIQVNYLGHPGTLGTDRYDYMIGDRFVTPPEHYDGFAERIVTMPHTYLVTNDIKGRVPGRISTRAEVGLPQTGFVFACFNATFKITPDVFRVWTRLLKSVEGSILWLSDPGPTGKRNLRTEAKEQGIDPDRLIFAARTEGLDYLARYRIADLFLDTFHYNAHATASEALMVGLPVVTRVGQAFAGRVAAGLLNAIGLPELVASNAEGYERIALELAKDPRKLKDVREKLLRNAATHPLFDTERYTRDLESAYHAMWDRYAQGLAPDHIRIADQYGSTP